ncbi:Conserved oligomeric Golgi complex subunit 5 [Hypsibius exemplaris]|uniref:Conserved oligomeric Golgi complex subunit 5 n=1 Tax=Hypsibius exemplaris TaxID=2072580 RepID=A0A1W0WPX9_HYPEX|nr:Conserved oligomeric Golgi complex subunit 5 [Hypsibius exemplaris]
MEMAVLMEDILMEDGQCPEDVRRNIRTFLAADFDPQAHSRAILQQPSQSLAEHLAQIEAGIASLDGSIKNQVLLAKDHDHFTANVSAVDALEASLSNLVTSSSNLLALTESSFHRFRTLHDEYSTRLEAFARAKKAMDLLRKANRISQAAKRLRACMTDDSADFGKAAVVVTEIGSLFQDYDLQSVTFVETDLKFVADTVASLPNRIVESLSEAVSTQDLGKIGFAVDACLVFGNVEDVLAGVAKKFFSTVQTLIETGLDHQQLVQSDASRPTTSSAKNYPGRTTLPSVQNSPALRTAFWGKLDVVFDAIYQHQIRIELLESVYLGRYEQYALYSVDAPDVVDGRISRDFFRRVVETLVGGLNRCGKESTFLQQILENEFPRLLKMVKDTVNRLRSATLFLDGPNLAALRDAISSFQSLFVSRSLSRLLEPVNAGFGENSLPTGEDLTSIFRSITNELVVCSADEALAVLVCGNIARQLRLIFVKLESAIATDGEATQVIGSLTGKQTRNFKVIDLAYKVKFGVEKVLKGDKSGIPETAKRSVEEIVQAYEGPVRNVLTPLRESLADSVESILLTMHDEDFSGNEDADPHSVSTPEILDSTCSRYMRELQEFLLRAQQTFFSQIDITQPLLRSTVAEFARRCVELFIRHASLVRPVGTRGRLKLAGDFAQLEAALAPLNLKSHEYGRELAVLKAFRPLLFQTPGEISENSTVGPVVPFSVALHHLFSRAPTDLQSPYGVSGWSVSRYSRYLDEHPRERDRLLGISGGLDGYAQAVRNRGETHYAVIYPVMKELLGRALSAYPI